MSKLRVNPKTGDGQVINITPQSAGWDYVGFDVWKLKPGGIAKGGEKSREVCLVFVCGKGKVVVDDKELGELGKRMSPFEGKPW